MGKTYYDSAHVHAPTELVLKRNEDIEELTMRTEKLHDSSNHYKVQSTKVKKKMVWKNRKWAFILACICIILLGVRVSPAPP